MSLLKSEGSLMKLLFLNTILWILNKFCSELLMFSFIFLLIVSCSKSLFTDLLASSSC